MLVTGKKLGVHYSKFLNYQSKLDFDPMTLVLDLGIVKVHLHSKDKVSMSRYAKVAVQTDT